MSKVLDLSIDQEFILVQEGVFSYNSSLVSDYQNIAEMQIKTNENYRIVIDNLYFRKFGEEGIILPILAKVKNGSKESAGIPQKGKEGLSFSVNLVKPGIEESSSMISIATGEELNEARGDWKAQIEITLESD